MRTKHIAMWACPRTRSSAITRAFDQKVMADLNLGILASISDMI